MRAWNRLPVLILAVMVLGGALIEMLRFDAIPNWTSLPLFLLLCWALFQSTRSSSGLKAAAAAGKKSGAKI